MLNVLTEQLRSNSGIASAGSPRSRGRAVKSLVVIGNGMVSYKLCERLAALEAVRRFRITVLGEEPQPAYDRVHLTQLLGGKSADQLQLAPREWYRDQGIELITGDPVVLLDRQRRVVRTRSGREVGYDTLVFATGSRAFVPTIEGRNLPGVFVYRTVEDLAAIKEHSIYCRRAAVLGGGLLGLEAAHALKQLGLDTWVVERGVGLLTKQLDPEASRMLAAHTERLGLRLCVGRETERIESIGPDRLLQFRTGDCLRVQLVVIAAGIRPRDEIAEASGLRIGQRGGIEVNDFLQTSDPAIYAVGECASHHGSTYGLAAPGYQMADALASTLQGRRRKFVGTDQSTSLKLPGVHVAALGNYQGGSEDLVARREGVYRRLVFDEGRLVGALGIGEWPEQARVQELIDRRGRLWRWRRERFCRTGNVFRQGKMTSVVDWPVNAVVCNCMSIRRGALTAACATGCTTIEQLARLTGASTVCGSCRPLLADFVGAPAIRRSLPGVRTLFGASLVTLVFAILTWCLVPMPMADTVQGGWKFDALWRDPVAKQVSGFTILGLALISLVLSARKRLKRFQFGEVGVWRAVHAVLGAATLVALVTHTGFRLGQNFNFILMTNFLALALVGALAGGVNALEARLAGPSARRVRAVWTGAHIALVWPLPVLIAVHVIAAYWF